MAQTKYTYSIATDTASAAVDVNALQEEVRASAIVIALDFINAFGDVLDIYMKDALTAGDETILNGVVTAHTAVPLPDDFVQKVLVTANADALGASNTLKVSQIVTAGAQVADTLVVPNGQTATVKFLEASCPDSALAVVRLIWDWVFQRSNVAPSEVVFSYVGDGVKKLAVCADNSANSDYYFNAFAKVEVV
jgi:hypothetical protein